MNFRFFLLLSVLLLGFAVPVRAMQSVPDNLYPGLEYLLTIPASGEDVAPANLSAVVDFVQSTPANTSLTMQSRDKATGAFHSFVLKGDLQRVVDYVYNPDIPVYVTMPSSVREQEWLSAGASEGLRRLSAALTDEKPYVFRGQEREIITPDANTGGYYAYRQDRAVMIFQGATGPVLISVGCQNDPSEVGRKGLVVGDDTNWNYLYSEETGLTKTGLGWVDSYMYNAHSILVFVTDTRTREVRIGSFKWLNAGWAGMNMVKPVHIVNGIKRFAVDFTTVLEASRLPKTQELAGMYTKLQADSADQLREMIAPYVQALQSDDQAVTAAPFKNLLASGDYLRGMTQSEMVKVLLQEFVKKHVGRESVLYVAQTSVPGPTTP